MARAYPREVRDRALAMLQEGKSLKEVSEATGIIRPTLSKWAKKAGVATLPIQRASQAVAAQSMTYAEAVAQLVPQLGNIAAVGVKATLARLQMLFPDGVPDPDELRDLDLAKLVGAWTRAIHDLQLLSGKATESLDLGSDVDRQIVELVEELGRTPALEDGRVHESG